MSTCRYCGGCSRNGRSTRIHEEQCRRELVMIMKVLAKTQRAIEELHHLRKVDPTSLNEPYIATSPIATGARP